MVCPLKVIDNNKMCGADHDIDRARGIDGVVDHGFKRVRCHAEACDRSETAYFNGDVGSLTKDLFDIDREFANAIGCGERCRAVLIHSYRRSLDGIARIVKRTCKCDARGTSNSFIAGDRIAVFEVDNVIPSVHDGACVVGFIAFAFAFAVAVFGAFYAFCLRVVTDGCARFAIDVRGPTKGP